MSDAAGTHSDGVLIFGSQVLTIGTLTTVADDINVEFDSTVLSRKNEVGVVTAEVLIELPFTGTATLQLADASTAAPAIGAAFTLKAVGGATINAKVKKAGNKFTSEGETKIPIEFRKRYATS